MSQFCEGYVDPATDRVAVKVSDYANSDLNGDAPAYLYTTAMFDLEAWRLIDGVDISTSGGSFDIWGAANWSKTVGPNYIIFLSRKHYDQLKASGQCMREVLDTLEEAHAEIGNNIAGGE